MRTFRCAGPPPYQTPVTAETQQGVREYRGKDEAIERKNLQVDRITEKHRLSLAEGHRARKREK